MDYHLTIAHLYPKTMGTYGDRGNIVALAVRCRWRNIGVTIVTAEIGDEIPAADLYFWGGGQDQEQSLVSADMHGAKADFLRKKAETYTPMLAICGGYQLMGKFYAADSRTIPGISVLDIYTEAGRHRMIGNSLIALDPASPIAGEQRGRTVTTIVGFENHSGRTYLGPKTTPLGRVITGYGNNGQDRFEGAVYKNVIGCYQHGPLLVKNHHLTDFLIRRALEVKYRTAVALAPLDDTLEWKAHTAMVKRLTRTRFRRGLRWGLN